MNTKKTNRYLLDYRKNIVTQFGEDGIIEKIFTIVEPTNKWCVEFGAWDGKHFSNTYNLIQNGWDGVLIEGDVNRCREIKENHKDKNVTVVNAFVLPSGDTSLDSILSKTKIPYDFDFLSIDIDGNDYHIWKSLIKYRPKVIVIEFNPFIPGNIEFVQKDDANVRHGNSILSMTKLAKEKGYELICINQENAFYVEKKYFNLFGISDNSIDTLKHYREPLQVYQLYDGTIRFHGSQYLYYYSIGVDMNRKFQVLPEWLRRAHVPWDTKKAHGWFYPLLLRVFRRWYRFRVRDESNKEGPFDWKQRY